MWTAEKKTHGGINNYEQKEKETKSNVDVKILSWTYRVLLFTDYWLMTAFSELNKKWD